MIRKGLRWEKTEAVEKPQESIEAIRKEYPVDAELFGTIGAVTAKLCTDVSKDFIDRTMDIMDIRKFEEIGDASKRNQVYWREMLFRVYWAAALNLTRHQRWQAGCAAAFKEPANFLSFAANLRGLIEGALDANYSLGPVPYTLADSQMMIESSLKGSLDKSLVAEELEDRLIHFVYGRKVGKAHKAVTPRSHTALDPKDYRNAIGLPEGGRKGFVDLYDELSGLCHPTAFSVIIFWKQTLEGDVYTVRLTEGEDAARIRQLCQKHANTVEFAMSLSVTVSALCLKTLNLFPLPEVRCPSIERWNFDDVPAWSKVQAKLSKGPVH